jgi:hypothetical protein
MVGKIKKKSDKKPIIPQKRLYTVKLETIAPVELIYRVLAESPEQAMELFQTMGQLSAPPKPIISRKRNIKATVYKYMTTTIEFVKKYT